MNTSSICGRLLVSAAFLLISLVLQYTVRFPDQQLEVQQQQVSILGEFSLL